MLRVDAARLRRMWVAAQLLHRPAGRSPADVVTHLVGIQAQAAMAAELGIRARSRRTTIEDVDRARIEERSIVRTWAMRGTLHFVSAEDFGWLVPLTIEPARPVWRRLAEEGVSAEATQRALGLIQRMLSSEGPLTRAEMADRLRARRIEVRGQAMAHLTWLAAAKGHVCFGPTRSGRPTFVLVRDWLGRVATMDRDRALAELALRYLASHGPALPEDLAVWSGLRMRDVRRAWMALADRLAEVETDGIIRWRPKRRRIEASPDVVRLLPMFDEYLLGWRSRDPVLAERHRRLVVPGGGMILQSVVSDGTVRGTWAAETRGDGLVVTFRPFARPDPSFRRALVEEANDVGRFRRLPRAGLKIDRSATR